jgi:soluble lytic murein transglycosylase
MKIALLMIMMIQSLEAFSSTNTERKIASSAPTDIRVRHARELLGSRKLVRKIAALKDIKNKIRVTVKQRLPHKYKGLASSITNTIVAEASKHHLDPYFVMAVIAGESSFNPDAVGPVGEVGLMQIRPTTGAWIAKKFKIKWQGNSSLNNPVKNIIIGTAYIAYLREKFARQGQLYIAAYNMGAANVRRALSKNVRPKDYPIHVMKRYIAFYQE